MNSTQTRWILAGVVCFGAASLAAGGAPEKAACQIRLDPGHPWRPPFGLARVGQPLTAVVEIASDRKPAGAYRLVGYQNGNEVGRRELSFSAEPPYTSRATLETWPTELVVLGTSGPQGKPVELARQAVEPPPFEAEAIARPDTVINPVDLGTILVPTGWLLLADDQRASVDVAAIRRTSDVPGARVVAWFESQPQEKRAAEIVLTKDRRAQVKLQLPTASGTLDRDLVHVAITGEDGKELWHKPIRTMLVHEPPEWPEFGARETKLRYDAPISVRAEDGTLSSMDYADGWAPHLKDVVVSLPNGSRFVFWRGASYVPFWAGRHNTVLSYEWAETGPLPEGFVDSVEPLMDKELRYGRVEIVESTAARVHVRWSYQSCDFNYKVWGDSAVEDFYFYPDGFGTRALTLQSALGADYEVSEFIILTPQATYPFSVLPPNLVDVLFVDGHKRELLFPFFDAEQAEKRKPRDLPAIYRVRLNREEPLAAVYFNPLQKQLPPAIFAPFFDRGYLVTPTYWGSHWPLARGKSTGHSIDERVHLTPAHNSVMSWARARPAPVSAVTVDAHDTLGQSKRMKVEQWVWLIGMSNRTDERLLAWARSFAHPPSLEIDGARLDSYRPQCRASRLVLQQKTVTITIKPTVRCVNPVFELMGAPKAPLRAKWADRPLDPTEYAWDGQTLWLSANVDVPTLLRLEFADPPP